MFLLRNQTRPTPDRQEAQQAGAHFQGAFDKPAGPQRGFWKAYGHQQPVVHDGVDERLAETPKRFGKESA